MAKIKKIKEESTEEAPKRNVLKEILKHSVIKETSLLSKSAIYNNETFIPTKIPVLNLFLSGKFKGGIAGNHTAIAGASASFKSMLGLIMIKTYLDYYEDGIAIIYDSEKGFTSDYLNSLGIDADRIVIKPFGILEAFKNDIVKVLDGLQRGDHVIILVDSISNSGSAKELNDSLENKDTTDMTRARVIKSIFRMITSSVAFKEIPLISINHTYSSMDKYKEDEVSGGGGVKYSATNTLRISKLKNAETGGVDFKIKAGKSRYIKEHTTFLLSIPKDGDIRHLSGLFELAVDYGFITTETQGWYEVPCLVDYPKTRRRDIENDRLFWKRVFEETNFAEIVEKSIAVSQDQKALFQDIDEEFGEEFPNTEPEVHIDEN